MAGHAAAKRAWSRLPALCTLRHTYVSLRHGQSEANVTGLISSDPAIATVTHGLTEKGRQQALRSVDLLASLPVTKCIFLTSDFTRARETAEIAHAGLVQAWADEGKGRCVCQCRTPQPHAAAASQTAPRSPLLLST